MQTTTSTPQHNTTGDEHEANVSDAIQIQKDPHSKEEPPTEQTISAAPEPQTHTPSDPLTADQEESRDGPPGPLLLAMDATTPHPMRTNSEAIGPDLASPMLQDFPRDGPNIQFILLLASAGTRHPFQLNEKYLAKRNVGAMGPDGKFDPSVISVYNLKELIFKDWRDGKNCTPRLRSSR